MAGDTPDDGYVLARTVSEYERLRAQAEIWSPLTDKVLGKAGLGAGMSVLDAGCGPGEVMRLMAKRVGPAGSVTGVDIDADVAAYGFEQMQAELVGNFHFHTANLLDGSKVPGGPFDFVFCRFLLLHMDDPVEMVRRLAAQAKPGGTLIVMDYVMDSLRVWPFHPKLQRGIEIINGALAAAGRPLDAGVRLGEWFTKAGLPMPHGTDAEASLAVIDDNTTLANAVEGLGASAVRFGLASEDEIARLPGEMRAVAAKREHLILRPTVTAAWTRVGG